MPGLVEVRIPVLGIIEPAAIDAHHLPVGTGDEYLQGAGESGAAAGHAAARPAQGRVDARPRRGIAVFGVDRVTAPDRFLPLLRIQLFPVALTQGQEAGVGTLGSQVHPGIAQRPVLGDAFAVPQHLGHHRLRDLVRIARRPAEKHEGPLLLPLLARLQSQMAEPEVGMGRHEGFAVDQLLFTDLGMGGKHGRHRAHQNADESRKNQVSHPFSSP